MESGGNLRLSRVENHIQHEKVRPRLGLRSRKGIPNKNPAKGRKVADTKYEVKRIKKNRKEEQARRYQARKAKAQQALLSENKVKLDAR